MPYVQSQSCNAIATTLCQTRTGNTQHCPSCYCCAWHSDKGSNSELTNQVEAEDPKRYRPKQGERTVQICEQCVQERSDWRVHKDVEQDLEQPADAEYHSDNAKKTLEPEGDDCDCPSIIRVCALQSANGNDVLAQLTCWKPEGDDCDCPSKVRSCALHSARNNVFEQNCLKAIDCFWGHLARLLECMAMAMRIKGNVLA